MKFFTGDLNAKIENELFFISHATRESVHSETNENETNLINRFREHDYC